MAGLTESPAAAPSEALRRDLAVGQITAHIEVFARGSRREQHIPRPDVEVEVLLGDDPIAHGRTDAAGRSMLEFALPRAALMDGTILDVRALGHYSTRAERVPAVAATADEPPLVELLVALGRTVRGRVVDFAGRPVPEADVWLEGNEPLSMLANEQTDVRGRFEVAVGAKNPRLKASHDRLGSTAWIDASDLEAPVVLRLVGATVVGRVVDGLGEPLADYDLGIEALGAGTLSVDDDHPLGGRLCAPATTDEDGEFEFTGLRPGPYRLAGADPDGSFADQYALLLPHEVEAPSNVGTIVARPLLLEVRAETHDGQRLQIGRIGGHELALLYGDRITLRWDELGSRLGIGELSEVGSIGAIGYGDDATWISFRTGGRHRLSLFSPTRGVASATVDVGALPPSPLVLRFPEPERCAQLTIEYIPGDTELPEGLRSYVDCSVLDLDSGTWVADDLIMPPSGRAELSLPAGRYRVVLEQSDAAMWADPGEVWESSAAANWIDVTLSAGETVSRAITLNPAGGVAFVTDISPAEVLAGLLRVVPMGDGPAFVVGPRNSEPTQKGLLLVEPHLPLVPGSYRVELTWRGGTTRSAPFDVIEGRQTRTELMFWANFEADVAVPEWP
ncbi:hypothetical protein Pla86_17020 [Planctomycetes bacterium Pla86]|uniref:Carboxypeptidase regulatory-like domain-containing protein n=2 Tax=Engelhardtia mirabilis TaxID=2528011 RepID=A0A518BI21_9BACT|nr:hypothetical protein Pla133_17030 [Planctomycetes bacterium Pla133]QDV00953.1 hypothetical protein Pla86_17020 [Planctomycetes bacterium Pla86]